MFDATHPSLLSRAYWSISGAVMVVCINMMSLNVKECLVPKYVCSSTVCRWSNKTLTWNSCRTLSFSLNLNMELPYIPRRQDCSPSFCCSFWKYWLCTFFSVVLVISVFVFSKWWIKPSNWNMCILNQLRKDVFKLSDPFMFQKIVSWSWFTVKSTCMNVCIYGFLDSGCERLQVRWRCKHCLCIVLSSSRWLRHTGGRGSCVELQTVTLGLP